MWIKFSKDFPYIPPEKRAVTVKYKSGNTYNVTRTCAEQAIKAGAGEEVQSPRSEGKEHGDSSASQDGNSQLQEEAASVAERPGDPGGESVGEERKGDAGGGEA